MPSVESYLWTDHSCKHKAPRAMGAVLNSLLHATISLINFSPHETYRLERMVSCNLAKLHQKIKEGDSAAFSGPCASSGS